MPELVKKKIELQFVEVNFVLIGIKNNMLMKKLPVSTVGILVMYRRRRRRSRMYSIFI